MGDLHRSLKRQSKRVKAIRLGQSSGDPTGSDGTETEETAGGVITVTDPKTCLIGLAAGMQFSTDTFGACATTAIDQVEQLKQFEKDFKKIFKTGEWFTAMVFNPSRLTKSMTAAYE